MFKIIAFLLVFVGFSVAADHPVKTGNPYVINGIKYYPLSSVSTDYQESGVASWYGSDFHGKKTANGEIYNMHDMTAAHKTLPLPTFVRVENLDNGREIVVRVNDRGPFAKGRIIDLSYAAAHKIGMAEAGTARVRITVLSESQDHLRTESIDVDINEGAFAVQIGAFGNKDNAERLAAKYESAAVTTATVGGKLFYRVHIRGYKTKYAAYAAAESLEYEFPGAFVIGE